MTHQNGTFCKLNLCRLATTMNTAAPTTMNAFTPPSKSEFVCQEDGYSIMHALRADEQVLLHPLLSHDIKPQVGVHGVQACL